MALYDHNVRPNNRTDRVFPHQRRGTVESYHRGDRMSQHGFHTVVRTLTQHVHTGQFLVHMDVKIFQLFRCLFACFSLKFSSFFVKVLFSYCLQRPWYRLPVRRACTDGHLLGE